MIWEIATALALMAVGAPLVLVAILSVTDDDDVFHDAWPWLTALAIAYLLLAIRALP